jgi:DNA-directed RNA polymerase specialized sigma24 family protein
MNREAFEAAWEEIRAEAVRMASYAGLGRGLWSPADARDEAEDVVQNVMLRSWKKRHLYDPKRGSFEAWVLGIVRKEVEAVARQRHRRVRLVASRFGSWDPGRGDSTPPRPQRASDLRPDA